MGKPKSNPNLRALSAMLGDTVIVRKVRGQIHLINRRPRQVRPTKNQLAQRERFREATQYASQQVSQAESKALYETGITKKKHTSHLVALSDYLNAPKVSQVDTIRYHGKVGDTLTVHATDDFMVTKVIIVITDAAGAQIEKGEAMRHEQNGNLWEYQATAANAVLKGTTISVTAYDRPRNKGTAVVKL